MAKGKKGDGAMKKGKASMEEDPNALTEVSKTFYELTITDLNRKLARLKTLTTELEQKNEEHQQNLTKLDEDRGDVIIFLKRMLQEKKDEIKEMQEQLFRLEETRSTQVEEFKEKAVEMEEEYRQMHEQLTSEIKLLTGKLNALEEFRLQRDELMKKFVTQEHQIEEQEMRHKREIYENEKKFIIGKDKLKKEMEARLVQLSTEFQDVTEIRIASTTHRVIRENISINNELDSMMTTHQRLYSENGKLKNSNKTLKLEAESHLEEKEKALAKANVQMKIIEKLRAQHEAMTRKLNSYKKIDAEVIKARNEVTAIKKSNEKLNFHIRILEQNLHASKCDRTNLRTELGYCRTELDRLSSILYDSVMSIKAAFKSEVQSKNKALQAAKLEALLKNLLDLMSKAQAKQPRQPSLESVASLVATYDRGDLGFVPKPIVPRIKVPLRRNVEVQIGNSFEELLALYSKPADVKESGSSSFSMEQDIILELEEQQKAVTPTIVPPSAKDIKTIFDESSETESESSEEVIGYATQLLDDEVLHETRSAEAHVPEVDTEKAEVEQHSPAEGVLPDSFAAEECVDKEESALVITTKEGNPSS